MVEHPRNPDTWIRLAQFELDDLGLPSRSLQSAQAAATIDPASTRAGPAAATEVGPTASSGS